MNMTALPIVSDRDSSSSTSTLVRDLVEMSIVLLLYAGLVARLIPLDGEQWTMTNLLLLPSEGMVVFFMLFRRRAARISLRWENWLLALSATVAPMLVRPSIGAAIVWPLLGAGLLAMGTIIQVHAKLSLGRSFGCVPANRGIKLTGPYRLVRHPMYAGYLLGHVAFLLVNFTVWNAVVYAACYALQIPRLLSEEQLLAEDPQYRAYQANVRYRLIPGIF
jgi:protein-S-isoprenylcysteine O-methyltransferase Ste14